MQNLPRGVKHQNIVTPAQKRNKPAYFNDYEGLDEVTNNYISIKF